MSKTAEEVLFFGRTITDHNIEFIPKVFAKDAINVARLEVAEFFINLSGVFGHYSFFTQKLWKKVKGFEKEDEAEIIAAFLNYWFHNQFGFYTCPCGSGWFAELGEDCYNDYITKYIPLFEAYSEWCTRQR